jgi:repressor LexA
MIRIKELLKQKGMTARYLSEQVRVAESTMSLYISGKREPDYTTLRRIAAVLDVPVDYLLGGDVLTADVRPVVLKRFPMLGEIACGEPVFANEEHETFIDGADDIDADFCLTCRGDSMIEARIHDGDVVFVKRQDTVENG